ncbi:MAG: S-layer homology domain-containing protein, partial [Acidimicrobiia bacterium]
MGTFIRRGLLIALLLAVPAGVADASSGSFVDDDGNIHEGNIEAIAAQGITKGCNPPINDHYCPAEPTTRAQMASFLVRAFQYPATEDQFFTDTAGSVHQADINALAAAHITFGCNPPANDRFCPDDQVTRAQMAAFLVRGLELTDDGAKNWFTDDNGSIFEAD